MNHNYKIEVHLTPNVNDNPSQPFFWILFEKHGTEWTTSLAGWSTSPDKAWSEAYVFYSRYKVPK